MSRVPDLGFVHRFVPATKAEEQRTLLLLHGTGGNEDDLLPLGRHLLPGRPCSARAARCWSGACPGFSVAWPKASLTWKTCIDALVNSALRPRRLRSQYGSNPGQVVAAGYSNGANIAASLLLQEPGTLAGAVLFHPMVPFIPEALPDLTGTPVFIGAGRADPMVPQGNTEELAELLRRAGATVSLHWQAGGHQLSEQEVQAARDWLASQQDNP
jgi:predicted esterase